MVQKIARFIAESPVLRRIVALVAGVLVLGLVVLTGSFGRPPSLAGGRRPF